MTASIDDFTVLSLDDDFVIVTDEDLDPSPQYASCPPQADQSAILPRKAEPLERCAPAVPAKAPDVDLNMSTEPEPEPNNSSPPNDLANTTASPPLAKIGNAREKKTKGSGATPGLTLLLVLVGLSVVRLAAESLVRPQPPLSNPRGAHRVCPA